jgi:phage terminase large subunit GpA-like protein
MVSTAQRKQKEKWSNWLHQSLSVLKPPEALTVSEWADKHRVLDSKTSAEPGPWSTDRTPYLRAIMDCFCDHEVEEIIFGKGTQIGGTETLNNILGYIVDQDPSPTLIVYPTLELAKWTSTNRLQPMIDLCKSLKNKFIPDTSKILELQFTSMYLCLSGANSKASLATRPVRYILFDEIDKYPAFCGNEANPMALAIERARTYQNTKKIFKTSTPTYEGTGVLKEIENADRIFHPFVTCPHCGHEFVFNFDSLEWNNELETVEAKVNSTVYKCEKCKGIISDAYKQQMINNVKWKTIKDNGKKRTAFWINCFYSPWLRFCEIVEKFLTSKEEPEKLMNFVNSWLAEGWKEIEVQIDNNIVKKRQSEYERGIVPEDVQIITAGVDVQESCLFYTIRGWGSYITSWNIDHGVVATFEEIEYIMNLPFYKNNGEMMQVNLCCMDSGDQTEFVYDFCIDNMEWCKPVKGSSRPLATNYNISSIDRIGSKAHGSSLYIVDTAKYKDMIIGRMQRDNGQGSWMVHKDIDDEYCKQIISEEKIREKRGEGYIFKWQKRPGFKHNHFLDCEVYAALAADLMQVRYLRPENMPQVSETTEIQEDDFIPDSNSWINNNNWFNNNGSWLK